MTTKCPVCGKKFVILYPHLYVYRRGSGKWLKYFCSYTCVREFDRKDIKMKLTLEHKKKAVEIALDGGSPIRYLESCGSANAGASWAYIKKCLQKKDPETYMKLPEKYRPSTVSAAETPEGSLADAMAGMKDAADTFFGKCQDMGLKIETPEEPKLCYQDEITAFDGGIIAEHILKPVCYDGMKIREVEGEFGRYRYASSAGTEYIDFENADKLETISLTVEQWREFRKEQEKAARILGVEL